MDKPRVLIFSDCYIYGGSERLMTFLLKNEDINRTFDLTYSFRKHKTYMEGFSGDIQKLGINVDFYPLRLLSNETLFHTINCTSLPGLLKTTVKVPFFLLQALGLYFVYNLIILIAFLKKIQPKVVHVNNGGYPGARSCNQFVLAARLCGINAILYQVNNITFKTGNPFAAWYDKIINKYVKYFITASARAKDALIKERDFDSRKMAQIPNTISVEKISKSRSDILKSLNWPESSFLLVQVAFLTGRKGQINLLKAIRQIVLEEKSDLPAKIKLVLVGNGEDENMLKKYVKDNELDGTVFFAGYSPESADYINAADVFVLPSVANEDMPLSLLTAMSYGKPILASRFAGIAEAVADGQNGLLIDPDPSSITGQIGKALIALYAQPDKRNELGESAKKTFTERYSEEIYGKRINSLYWQVLS